MSKHNQLTVEERLERLERIEGLIGPSPVKHLGPIERIEIYAAILEEPNVRSWIEHQGGLNQRIGQISGGLREIAQELRNLRDSGKAA